MSGMLIVDVDFPAGSSAGTTVVVSLSINDDCHIEDTETFSLSIVDSALYTTGTVSSRNVSISDNDCKLEICFL